MHLSADEQKRYERNTLIPGLGESGQLRLKSAKVAIAGLGGLGSPVVHYLAAAGVGALALIDYDSIELSNLQRQVLHTTARIGMSKAASAAAVVKELNPHVTATPVHERLNRDNAAGILADYDVVVEATDNFEAKFLLNDVCVEMGKPLATAGILAMSGQAQFIVPGKTPCLRCLVPDIPADTPTTGMLGVLGAVPGVLGSLEALEIIRYLTGQWQPAADGSGLLHRVDGETMNLRTLRVHRSDTCACARLWP